LQPAHLALEDSAAKTDLALQARCLLGGATLARSSRHSQNRCRKKL